LKAIKDTAKQLQGTLLKMMKVIQEDEKANAQA